MTELNPYPVLYSVDYPDRKLNRLTSFFWPLVALPIVVLLATLTAGSSYGNGEEEGMVGAAGGLLFIAPLLMILFRHKYPRWWFDWNLELLRFGNRVLVYLALMDDRYPSTDEPQAVRLELPYPDVESDLNRWLPLVKWFLVIPHLVLLLLLSVADESPRVHRRLFDLSVRGSTGAF